MIGGNAYGNQYPYPQVGRQVRAGVREPALLGGASPPRGQLPVPLLHRRFGGASARDRGTSDPRRRRASRLAAHAVAQARALSGRSRRALRPEPLPRPRHPDHGPAGWRLHLRARPAVHHPRLGEPRAAALSPPRPAHPRTRPSSGSSPAGRALSSSASWRSATKPSHSTGR